MASWATRTPAIRDILSISTAEMGAVLFGLSIGSMSGILCSAWLVKRFGTRKVIRTTMSCAVIGMAILSVALWLHSAWLFAFGLAVFGASFGAAEVAINVEGAAVEREMNKPCCHDAWFYSLGTLAGAGVGMMLTAFSVPANAHILLAGAGSYHSYLYRHQKRFLTARVKMPLMVLPPVKKDCLFIAISSYC